MLQYVGRLGSQISEPALLEIQKNFKVLGSDGEYSFTPNSHIGCKTCADSNVQYIIHSVWINHLTECTDNPLIGAIINSKCLQLISIAWATHV